MFKIQCDKNFIRILERYFNILCISAEISPFSSCYCDICILRDDNLPEKFVPSSEYVLINSDDKSLIQSIKKIKSKVISCGLSTRSTATLSSISDGKSVMCLQRSIVDLSGKKHPQFEFPFELTGIFLDEISIIMLMVSALLCGADISMLSKIKM